jgi:tellurite resistance protein TerB
MKTLTDRLRGYFQKDEPDDPFLQAAMAASAVVSMSDGVLDTWEEVQVERVVEKVTDLQVFDPHRAGELHRSYASALAKDAARGKREAIEAVEKISGDREKSRLVVGVCIAVAVADREFSECERTAIRELCDCLGVSAEEADTWLSATRDPASDAGD